MWDVMLYIYSDKIVSVLVEPAVVGSIFLPD
jgi:hypothetical protein